MDIRLAGAEAETRACREAAATFCADLNRAFGYEAGGPTAPCELIDEAKRQHEKAWQYDDLCK
jgi:hypothetical protein